ncbi:sugar ABC transporter ATP-binding protein [Pelosinus propionicus]|uniref:Monosaccharide ABC transporter ATP-binding protein, CUT2 family n=1 Tax=Pelosinus propionicus DSM 13327 TaxID=1123291 RepID=A0A1I4PK98_9FIRM|nr:sugar ABC transporter ATP-binding protein [Pelosinus propionicus]SFM27945.1 monosaccharide ABC transporter ATP-binding protein, CUT2 family [Pelosinus propionicus DSM 13327]
MSKVILEMKNIHKRFPGVYALKDVNFELQAGEVHGVLGENGAGKSTLMKVLGGIYKVDDGEIYIEGQKIAIHDVEDSQNAGVSIIHQELVLVPHMSVAENIFSGREPTGRFGFIKKEEMLEKAQRLLDFFHLDINASQLVCKLNIAEQQMVEVARAISFNSKILVMDEPTSSLTEKEVRFLFATIQNLKSQGVGIIYISHRMSELFRITDRITVMRDGQYISTKMTNQTNVNELISLMVGRELTSYYHKISHGLGENALEVKELTRRGVFSNINFNLREGEILGFSGLVGAGRSEIMKSIFGLDRFDSGEIYIRGKEVTIKSPNDAMNFGIALVPENRKDEGLIMKGQVGYNMTLRILNQFIKFINVNTAHENQIISTYVKKLGIRTSSTLQLISNLSGGNQQKVVIAKWLAAKPQILILDEPTRGVDVNAKAEIYEIMNRLAQEGVAIIMISSELPEIINMSDRVIVVRNGSIAGMLKREEFSQERIMHMATGGIS